MNILILDSWLKDYIKTDAKPEVIAKLLSASSVSVERTTKIDNDYLYDIEVTTNRVDLMSVVGIARELDAVLNQNGIKSEFLKKPKKKLKTGTNELLKIKNDESLVNRISAVIIDVVNKPSPEIIKNRLEKTGIRSINNLVDITNYIMRTVGHPMHAFDYDRLGREIAVRESKKGETITTLDGKTYILKGDDIIATDGEGQIIDLLGVMGLMNSSVTNETKRIVLFSNNNSAKHIRKTSMGLGIRTEAAVLNEKNVDPELITDALNLGIELYEKYADGKVVGNTMDLYPNRPKLKTVRVRKEKINTIIGVQISDKNVKEILTRLSFKVVEEKDSYKVTPPSFRSNDIEIEEDVIEEIARIYGYDKIPNELPPLSNKKRFNLNKNNFYWEMRVKTAMKYLGFNEVYTYSMVSENLYEGDPESSVRILNPLSEEHIFMRSTIVPSLLEITENNYEEDIRIFEIANVYIKRQNDLPYENLHFAGVIKKSSKDVFFELKGILEALFRDLGIDNFSFRKRKEGGAGTDIYFSNSQAGNIELLEESIVNFEIEFDQILSHATNKKVFKRLFEFPPVIEDIRVEIKKNVSYEKITETIKSTSDLISNIELIDEYENKMTFRITYRDRSKNLSNDMITPIREKLKEKLKTKLNAKVG